MGAPMKNTPKPFDAAYYRRFYGARATRVQGAREVARLARGTTSIVAWLDLPLRNVLDVGAGTGLWRDWFRRHRPSVRYRSVDVSAYACATYGHEPRDISRWRAREKFDLIVCQGVLPYLDDASAARAIANLGAMARGVMYLEAVTKRDLETICDRALTDVTMRARSGAWYRRHLEEHFVPLALGVWLCRAIDPHLYELELAK